MEKRLVIAIVLSILVLVLWQALLVKKPEPVQGVGSVRPVAAPGQAALEKPAPVSPDKEPARSTAAPVVDLQPVASGAEEKVVIDTSLYRAEWSNKGGVLLSWRLKKHKNDKKEDLELVPLKALETGKFPFALRTEDAALADAANAAFYKTTAGTTSLQDGQKGEVRFEYSDGKNLKIEKTFVLTGGTYDVGIEVHAWKGGLEVEPGLLWGPGIGNPSPVELKQRFSSSTGVAVFSSGKVFRVDERKYKPEQSSFNFADWAAYEENYFTALFVLDPQKGTAVFQKEVKDNAAIFYLAVNRPQRAFIGPKDLDVLKAYGHGAKKIINFGFFGTIAEVLLASIKYFHKWVPNWGIAIIIMTFIIKIIFFPLTYSSMKSMAKMQELQPKIKALRAKYKKAKQDIEQRRQMNEEMMRLYKEHGVNPAGGCLPLIIQLPVFWGVFRMLVVAVEFRQSPFAFWIKDLSVKDPYYITPILMGVTQFIQQKMTPTSADPAQAKMMMIMPVIMTVFFLNFQSGLILYWLTQNALQIGQQAIMNRMMNKKKGEIHGKRRKD
ncbi:MAG: membrane protein insertase YidC [Candidatus Aminicenantes bacterium]|nr:membrane protein insertase YidC [Candidatus Aminicenantes bacterium]